MGRIFLCGIKHSGKTTLGRLLAQRLHIAWVDLDEYIEEAIEENIRSFYQREGHTAFQALEVRYLQQILAEQSDECIISLGGGAADNEALMTLLKDSGTLIYLWVEESELLKRIIATGIPPFLDPANVEASFHELFQAEYCYLEMRQHSFVYLLLLCCPCHGGVFDFPSQRNNRSIRFSPKTHIHRTIDCETRLFRAIDFCFQ